MDLDSLMLLEPGELHVTRDVPLTDFRVLLLQPEAVSKLFQAPGQPHFTSGQLNDHRLVQRLTQQRLQVLGASQPAAGIAGLALCETAVTRRLAVADLVVARLVGRH